MRYRTVTERVGEYLGSVAWGYNFRKHFDTLCGNRDEACAVAIDRLRRLAENKDKWEATTDGGWPRFGWHDVLEVGMYDGWPQWKPTPSVLLRGVLGPEWHPFYSITKETGETL